MGRLDVAASRRLVARGVPTSEAVARSVDPVTGPGQRLERWETLEASRNGFTPQLWALVKQPGVTDVVISGVKAWADFGRGLERVDLGLKTDADTRRLAVAMAAAAHRRLDDAQPIVDAVLPGPVRLNAVLPPLAHDGVSIALRVLRPRPFSLEELVGGGAVPGSVGVRLADKVRGGRSLLIAGATGAGKTTLLATLLSEVPPDQRIVVIEEVTEIAASHPHLVSLQARPANVEGRGGVGLEELVRAAVRMRPDRLVLGECRGPEVRDVLTALNTGHQGGMTTIHANSIEDVPARLQALGMLAGMDRETVSLMAASAFDQVVYMRRLPGGRRVVDSVGDLRLEGDQLRGVTTKRFWGPGLEDAAKRRGR